MIEQIDFYILGNADRAGKLKYACRIAQKAYQKGLKVYLHTENDLESQELDSMMWTFSQGSFIPHVISNDMDKNWEDYPVQLGNLGGGNQQADVLISLTDDVPGAHEKFRRIVDLVTDAPSDKAAGRKRFRYYRDKGIEPKTHNVA